MKDEVFWDTNTVHNITHEQAPSSQVGWGIILASQVGVTTNLANSTEYAQTADSQELHRGRAICGKAHSSALKYPNCH